MNKGYRKGVTPAIVVLILALVAIGLIVMGFPQLTGSVIFNGVEYPDPIIIISAPADEATFATVDEVTEMTWEFNPANDPLIDPAVDVSDCWYSLDEGENVITIDCVADTTISITPVEGENTWTVYATDNEDPANTIEVSTTFTVGEPEPPAPGLFAVDVPMDEVVTITYPVEGEAYIDEAPSILEYSLHENIDVDEDLIKCEYNDGGSTTNEQFSCIAPISLFAEEGSNTWTIFFYDKYDNVVSKVVSFDYSPEFTAPFSWDASSGDSSRDRYEDVLGTPTNTYNDYLIQPSLYGNIKTGSDKDYIYTSREHAYVATDTNKILKILIESGSVEKELTLNVDSGLVINSPRDLIYSVASNGRSISIINTTDMKILDQIVTSVGILYNPIIKGNKIFFASSSTIEIFDLVTPYDIEHNKSIAGFPVKVGLTNIVGSEFITFITTDNMLHILNTTMNEEDSYDSIGIEADCETLLSDIVSKGSMLYYMCVDNGGVIVEVDTSNLSDIKKSVYGADDPDIDRIKNAHKTAFAINNEWVYYGAGTSGITAVLLNNLEAEVEGNPLREDIGVVTSITVSGDTVYATNTVGTIYALDSSNITNRLWKEDLGTPGTKLYNTIFSTTESLLVLGENNRLYKFPKTGIEITLNITEGADWLAQGGRQTRKRYVNTKGATSNKFKRILINSDLHGFIKKVLGKDTVLTYGGYAYALRTDDSLMKIDLNTGKVVDERNNGPTNFIIDLATNSILGNSRGYVWKISLENLEEIVTSGNFYWSTGQQSWNCYACGECKDYCNVYSWRASELRIPFVKLEETLYTFTRDWRRERRRHCGTCACHCTVDWDRNGYVTRVSGFEVTETGGLTNYYNYPLISYTHAGRIAERVINEFLREKSAWVFMNLLPHGFNPSDIHRASEVGGSNVVVTAVINNLLFITKTTDASGVHSAYSTANSGTRIVDSEIISMGNKLYYISEGGGSIIRFNLEDNSIFSLNIQGQFNNMGAFAASDGTIYFSSISGSLSYVNEDLTTLGVSEAELDGDVTTITVVNDSVYVGTDTGWIYMLNREDIDEVIWSTKVTKEIEDQKVTSIIIPAEGSMLAVGGTNSLFLFGDAIELLGPEYCGNGLCDDAPGGTEACYDTGADPKECLDDCFTCDAYQEDNPDDEDPGRSDSSTNCRRNIDGESLWRDTEEPSENDCYRDGEKCCPWGQVCRDFSGVESDEGEGELGQWKCIFDGVTSGCSSYTTPETCTDFDMFAAFESVELAQGPGFCGSFADTGGYYDCQCVWDEDTDGCQPGWELVEIQDDGSEIVQESCQLTCADGECIGGIKTVTCSAAGTPEGVCSGSATQTGCQIPTEVPFFTMVNALVAVGILAGFYVLTRKH